MYSKKYHVEELTCPKCANKLIENLEKLSYIKEVHINYDTKDITIYGDRVLTVEQFLMVIEGILNEDHCGEHQYNYLHSIVTEEFNFSDIDCPNCASKVERELNKKEEIIDARVNFINKKIIIKHLNNVEIYDVVSNVLEKSEPGAKIYHNHEHHDHDHHHDSKKINKILMIIGIISFITIVILKNFLDINSGLLKGLYSASYILIGHELIIKSLKGLKNKDIFNENLLMIIASAGAIFINEEIEGVMLIVLFMFGEFLQDLATAKSSDLIKQLMELKVDKVTLVDGKEIDIENTNVGDVITVKVGERIPLDGIIVNGNTEVDMKALTGESLPISIAEGSEIMSGSINLTRVINVEVTKKSNESTIAKVQKLVEEASNQKSTTEKFITKFARIYTPVILIVAMIIALCQYFFFDKTINESLNSLFTILVISCPCALVVSIPLSYFAGIGKASSLGILVKGGNYFDLLNKVKNFVFDKTGTLTKGNFVVTDVIPYGNHTKEELLRNLSIVEQYSNHPVAEAIKKAFDLKMEINEEYNVTEIAGCGLVVNVGQDIIYAGNKTLMNNNNLPFVEQDNSSTVIYLCVNNDFYGSVVIKDEIREDSYQLLQYLNKNYDTYMLSGDNDAVVKEVATALNVKQYKSELLPKAKYESLKTIIDATEDNTVYVGDGLNDAPVLRLADVGIAMGGIGSDSSKECADIVIMNDDILKIISLLKVSKLTKKVTIQNIVFSLSIKLIVLVLGALGVLGNLGMLFAVLSDIGVCILAILNTLKITNKKGL